MCVRQRQKQGHVPTVRSRIAFLSYSWWFNLFALSLYYMQFTRQSLFVPSQLPHIMMVTLGVYTPGPYACVCSVFSSIYAYRCDYYGILWELSRLPKLLQSPLTKERDFSAIHFAMYCNNLPIGYVNNYSVLYHFPFKSLNTRECWYHY